jgi:hypothetical protein
MPSFECEPCNRLYTRIAILGTAEPPDVCESCGNNSFKHKGEALDTEKRYERAIKWAILTVASLVFLINTTPVVTHSNAPLILNIGSAILFVVVLQGRYHSGYSVSAGYMILSKPPRYQNKASVALPYAVICFVISAVWMALLYFL